VVELLFLLFGGDEELDFLLNQVLRRSFSQESKYIQSFLVLSCTDKPPGGLGKYEISDDKEYGGNELQDQYNTICPLVRSAF